MQKGCLIVPQNVDNKLDTFKRIFEGFQMKWCITICFLKIS